MVRRSWLSARNYARAAIRTGCRLVKLSRPPRGRLKARWVIHTVGPTYAESKDKSPLLADCFRQSLRIADELGAATVAFPAISTGVYRWPVDDAARIALETVRGSDARVDEVRFVLFDQSAYDVFTAQASKSEG